MKKILFSLFVLTVSLFYGQELQRIIPESPEAFAFSKYDKIPVNYHSGLPTIEIPLYTITTRSGLKIPVKLTYHSSGIKVNEHATQVGLGWNLQAGGMISREVYGLPDELYPRQYPMNSGQDIHTSLAGFSIFDIGNLPSCFETNEKMDDYYYATDVLGLPNLVGTPNPKSIDVLPDIFYYAFPGLSGKFILDIQGEAQSIPYEPIKIEKAGGPVDGFNITDPYGNLFEYNATATYAESPQLDPYASFVEQSKLSKITTYLNEVINFTYSTESYTYANPVPVTDYTPYANYQSCVTPVHNPTPVETQFNARRLDEITFEGGRIVFHYSDDNTYAIDGATGRRDLPGASALRRVVVYNTNNVIIKDYTLDYSYFSSNPGALGDPDAHRLKLDAVTQAGKPPYTFTYFGDGTIPHRLSDQQDYWGYYGGTGGLLPQVRYGDTEIPGSNRDVDNSLVKTGALSSITYPTKGTATFSFNETDYFSLQDEVQYTVNSTGVFNTKGIHVFTLPEDANNSRKIHVQNDCGNTGTGPGEILEEGYCFFQLLDDQDNVVFQTTDSGTYTVEDLPGDPSNYKFVVDQLDPQACGCAIEMEGETEQNGQVLKPSQLPGLRLDSMTMDPLQGDPVVTIFDYTIPGTGQISRPTELPGFYFLKKSITLGTGNDNNCTYIQRNGTPVTTYTSSGYQYVTVSKPGLGSTRYTFNTASSSREMAPLVHLTFGSFLAGLPDKTEHFHEDGRILMREENSYTVDASLNPGSADYMPQQPGNIALGLSFNSYGTATAYCMGNYYTYRLMDYNIYNIPGGWVKKTASVSVDYLYDENDNLLDEVTNTTQYYYDNNQHQQITRSKASGSKGDTLLVKTYYPLDITAQDGLEEGGPLSLPAFTNVNKLKAGDLHRLAVPIQVATYKTDAFGNQQLLSIQRNNYKEWVALGFILPETLQSSGDDGLLEDKINYHSYDTFGNPLQASREGDIPISYIWGYGNSLPIAKLEGVAYSDIDPATIANLQLLSDNDTDAVAEQSLRDALNGLRTAHPNATFNGFTYDPLIGVTSNIDNRGYVSFYSYDNFNRLVNIKDANSNIAETFDYHYAEEPVVYDPLNVAIDYGTDDTDHQWFSANISGGSGNYSYAWFEGIGDSSVNFEANASGTNDTYQLMVNCTDTKYVKLVVTDNITGEVTEQTKVNNNSCNYPPLSVSIGYGTHNDNSQNFTSNVSGGSGNYSYSWHKGVGTSSFNFEVSVTSTLPNCMVIVPCSTYKWVKLVITDTITGEIAFAIKKSNNSPCSGGGGGPEPFDPEQ